MREIRFRAWDRKRKEMFIVHEIHFDKISGVITYVSGYGETDKDGTAFYGGGERGYAKALRYVLQEFTGLRDKNGKEIYEGDILRRPGYAEGLSDYIVGFERGHFTLQHTKTAYNQLGIWNIADTTEVVGNIHENPELLTKEMAE